MQIERQDWSERFQVFPFGNPHHKSLKHLYRVVHRELGKKKVLIVYEGMEEAVALMSIVLPAWDRVLARQPSIFPRTLAKIDWKVSFLDFPMINGSSK